MTLGLKRCFLVEKLLIRELVDGEKIKLSKPEIFKMRKTGKPDDLLLIVSFPIPVIHFCPSLLLLTTRGNTYDMYVPQINKFKDNVTVKG